MRFNFFYAHDLDIIVVRFFLIFYIVFLIIYTVYIFLISLVIQGIFCFVLFLFPFRFATFCGICCLTSWFMVDV